MAGLAAEVTGAAAPAAQALLLLPRLLACPSSDEPGKSAGAPFLNAVDDPLEATRSRNTPLPAPPDDSVILVYLFVDE